MTKQFTGLKKTLLDVHFRIPSEPMLKDSVFGTGSEVKVFLKTGTGFFQRSCHIHAIFLIIIP
ncbi:MAG: hypothetical protein IJW77_05815, partial [Clostridia bacterium]|nr:hypothetical protein [Clostridia bacterium]